MIKDGGTYTDGNLVVCPTNNQDNLAAAYLRFKQDGLLKYLYYEKEPTLVEFLNVILAPGSLCLGAFRIDQYIPPTIKEPRVTLTGLAHLTRPVEMGGGYLRSDMQFGFFREFQDGVWTRRAAKVMLEHTFDRTPLETVIGYTAVQNKAMVRFAKSLGYRQSVIPRYSTWDSKPTDVVVSAMTRGMWEKESAKNSDFPGEVQISGRPKSAESKSAKSDNPTGVGLVAEPTDRWTV